jgi:hypothetical protein
LRFGDSNTESKNYFGYSKLTCRFVNQNYAVFYDVLTKR